MNNILIISIEGQNIKTEEIYFKNKKNKGDLSFKNDQKFLKKLNLNDVFFFSVNFKFTKQKVILKLKRLKSVKPNILECFIICDRDTKSRVDVEIQKQFNSIALMIKEELNIKINDIHYLKYKNLGQKFEDFLKCHSNNNQLFDGYTKIHKSIYAKTMGKYGKNLNIFIKNRNIIDGNNKFLKLFLNRPEVEFD